MAAEAGRVICSRNTCGPDASKNKSRTTLEEKDLPLSSLQSLAYKDPFHAGTLLRNEEREKPSLGLFPLNLFKGTGNR